jgi:hypothetical protein
MLEQLSRMSVRRYFVEHANEWFGNAGASVDGSCPTEPVPPIIALSEPQPGSQTPSRLNEGQREPYSNNEDASPGALVPSTLTDEQKEVLETERKDRLLDVKLQKPEVFNHIAGHVREDVSSVFHSLAEPCQDCVGGLQRELQVMLEAFADVFHSMGAC